ncbi:amino acid ABC transporter permease [Paraburkholderia caballeronis]|uniref:Amino acid ABC transporter membrane protein 2, PAAT family n=1 Tax=Paraburkholderia caballeronis TaxID=416943 RepID=A0A1H7P8Z9_9BURK|nr:amino acid ABC transporter permease [Paraburkholderia caballeronis]PXW25335.1 amino acid ABC transporter membrane protein 2 (PAAT family) [Paraburkholderia caballeronis]PXX00942.1 amino acid ABC transporter membrane protein 2 (PAAT family) [Paraburkholderia caballeronis]RAJ99705.1 amino acid ABC transporter membrane protein 2 (PAAT family) [Paraburkholderia caballeronis]TDV03518.1 amino acid ABC transporter membrane protein 2 (PAAT family) [Paraburkholderia caballeronis]TDV08409.1 amino aci
MDTLLALVPRFAAALVVTLEVSVLAALLGMLGGFALNALRLRFARAFAVPYAAFVWLIRGMPYLSQLVIVYFGLPALGVTMTAVEATVVSLAIYSSAYFAEIFRAAWASVPRGQLEAADAFGIGRWAAFRAIELPQAVAFAVPLLANQTILTIKESAVASIITVPELTMTASDIVASTYTYIGPYALLIASYWLLTQAVSLLAQRVTAMIPFLRKTS